MVRLLSHDVASSPPPRALFLELSSAPSTVSASLFFLIGILVLVVVLVLLAVWLKCVKPEALQKLMKSVRKVPSPSYFSDNFRTISYFNYQTLKTATNNFHPNNQLGSGGFGPVYQGALDDGKMIAVKQLSLGKSRQGESEFLSEVMMITSIQHKNLVRLVGCCSEGAQRLLVYEFMKNKSLDSIIFGHYDMLLNWKTRFQIILGIARGLQYLHEDSNLRIVHRDIKASNILLDEKFQPKISDFGLARFFPEDQAYLSTTFAGTLGYTAPEYAIRGELSEKADIYSFGVLVLEIISSRKNTDLSMSSEMQYLPEYAWRLYERSKAIDLIDPKLRSDGIVETDVLKTCQIAFHCLQPLPSSRPPMSEVVAMLTCRSEAKASPVKPTFMDRRRWINMEHSSDSSQNVCEVPRPSEICSPSSPSPTHSRTYPPPGHSISV